MHKTIEKLAEIIITKTRTEIERELRINGITLRNCQNNQLHNKTKAQQKILSIALNYLTQHSTPHENLRDIHTRFESLSDWLENATNIENHLQLAMLSWSCHLEVCLANSIPPDELVPLGSAFYCTPHKFIGFIYWLLQNDAPTHLNQLTNILEEFFGYHIWNKNTLYNSYQLLANLSDKATQFLKLIETTPCQMHAFTNNPLRNGFSSYSLSGQTFFHKSKFPAIKKNQGAPFNFDATQLGLTKTLFELFEWEFIKKLNLGYQPYAIAIKNLLQTNSREKLLKSFSLNATQGTLSVELSWTLLQLIQSSLDIETLKNLTQSEPFYLYAIPDNVLKNFSSHAFLTKALNTLCSDSTYKTPLQIYFLSKLAVKIAYSQTQTPLGINWTIPQVNLIIGTIFDIILPFENSLPDEFFLHSFPVLSPLESFSRQKLIELSQTLETSLTEFIQNKIDFETLETIRGNQLSTVNLLFRLHPQLKKQIQYPRCIYEFYAHTLQKLFNNHNNINEPNLVNSLLARIQCDQHNERRILQESLISNYCDQIFKEKLLCYIKSTTSIDLFVQQPFGNTRSVIFHAMTRSNTDLINLLAQHISIKNHAMNIMRICTVNNKLIALDQAWDYTQQSESNLSALFSMLLTLLEEPKIDTQTYKSIFSKARKLILVNQNHRIPKQISMDLLENAVKYEQIKLLTTLCSQPNTQLTSAIIKQAVLTTGIFWETWKAIAVLCGLSASTKINSSLVSPNNLTLYFQAIQRYQEHYQCPLSALEAPLMYKNDLGETLLHIAANTCSFDQLNIFFSYIRTCFTNKPEQIYLMLFTEDNDGLLPDCVNNTNPDKSKINRYLEELRVQYCKYANNQTQETSPDELTTSDDEFETGDEFDILSDEEDTDPNENNNQINNLIQNQNPDQAVGFSANQAITTSYNRQPPRQQNMNQPIGFFNSHHGLLSNGAVRRSRSPEVSNTENETARP